jgi:hypothetical protein
VLEFDEYAFRFGSPAPPDTVGAARIVDVGDEAHPRVVSNIRLEVDQPAEHHEASGDPGATSPVQGYAAHYCNVPREVDPGIVACSFISSGLRLFDIRDPLHPREIGYYIAPFKHAPENGEDGSNFAMSKPAFAPERREIWYTDGSSGFYVLRLPASLWPDATAPAPSTRASACARPTGRLGGARLGPVALGQTRALARRALVRFAVQPGTGMDVFCLSGGAIRAGYPSARLLRSQSRSQRSRLANHVVLALTANRFYALGGIRPGARVPSRSRTLRGSQRFTIGQNAWYLVRGKRATGVLRVRRGIVQEVGIATKALTAGRLRGRRLLSSF